MPANHRILLLPPWVEKQKKKQLDNTTLYHQLLPLMLWKPAVHVLHRLVRHAPRSALRQQMLNTAVVIKKHLETTNPHPLVARVSMSKFIPQEIIVTFAPNVAEPPQTASLVLRLNDDGTIREVAREYSMNHQVKDQPKQTT